MLQTKNLTLQYPGKLLCRDLSLTVKPGECWAILGQNGSGKTTLIHALGGLRPADTVNVGARHASPAPFTLPPATAGRGMPRPYKANESARPADSGDNSVTVAGKAPQTWPRRELARKLGVMLQEEPGEFWGNVQEYVMLGRHPHVKNLFGWEAIDHDIVMQAIARMELTGFADRPLDTLSGGERQRARIALLLAQSPQCYLLDEPLQHLDLRHQLAAMTLFRELAGQGSAVMMVLHDIAWADRYCDHVLMLFDHGRVLAGPTQELLTRSNLEALYQCSLEEFGAGHARHFVPSL